MATCQDLAWSRPADEGGAAFLVVDVTLKPRWFDFIPASDIHARERAISKSRR